MESEKRLWNRWIWQLIKELGRKTKVRKLLWIPVSWLKPKIMYGIEFSTNPDQMNNVIEYQVISSEDTTCENKVQILHNCTSCDAYFMDRDVLRRHIGLIHENKIPLECTYCYAVFIEHKKLTQHKVCYGM